jgi:hypothetical protein
MAQTIEDKIDNLVEDVSAIKVALKGYNGQTGLCESHEELKKDFYAFRRALLVILGVLVGSGLISFGAFGLAKACGL